MLTEETTIEDGAIEACFFHLLDHIDEDGGHVLIEYPGNALKVNPDLVFRTKMGHFLVKRVVDVILAQGDQENHFNGFSVIKRYIFGVEQNIHQIIDHVLIDKCLFITTEKHRCICEEGEIVLLDREVMTAQFSRDPNRESGCQYDFIPQFLYNIDVFLEFLIIKGAVWHPTNRGRDEDIVVQTT
jgi:hypothetical protein